MTGRVSRPGRTNVAVDAEVQKTAFDSNYGGSDRQWDFHYTDDPLTRYLRDRRLATALRILRAHGGIEAATHSVLVVCGGVGGEGTYLRKAGFGDVTVSDFSAEALRRCGRFDPALKTLLLDAERMEVADCAYDVVLVQDGLHHLSRPVLGFTEMLRVARHAVVVIEPHAGLVAQVAGTEWEHEGRAVNYVFRWNRRLLEQCTRSYLLSPDAEVIAKRIWDHGSVIARTVAPLPYPLRLPTAKAIYTALGGASRAGNMMIGVVIINNKGHDSTPPARVVEH